MKRILFLTKKKFLPLHNILAIVGMTAFALTALHFNWLENYKAFIMIPLLVAYFIGKYVGTKEQEK